MCSYYQLEAEINGIPILFSRYVVRPQSAVEFKAAATAAIKEGYRDKKSHHNRCSDPLRHKNFIFTPDWLTEWGIHHDVVEQLPNQVAFTHPLGGHQGVNTGPTVNEAINFAMKEWLPYGKRSTYCDCGE